MGQLNSGIPAESWHPGYAPALVLDRRFNGPPQSFDEEFIPTPVEQSGMSAVINAINRCTYMPVAVPHPSGAYPGSDFNTRSATILTGSFDRIVATNLASIGALKFVAHAKPEFSRAIESLKAFAARMFLGSSVSSTLYTDPEEGWQKLVLEVILAPSDRESAFDLEDQFIDAVCDSEEYDSVLRNVILRVR
jgi:hypothetical protein